MDGWMDVWMGGWTDGWIEREWKTVEIVLSKTVLLVSANPVLLLLLLVEVCRRRRLLTGSAAGARQTVETGNAVRRHVTVDRWDVMTYVSQHTGNHISIYGHRYY